MFNKINEIYNDVDKYVSKIVDDAIDDTSKIFSSYFNKDNTLKIENKDDVVLIQLSKINDELESLNFNSNDNWDKHLIFIASSLGHISETMTKVFCEELNIYLKEQSSQSYKINLLKEYLPRNIINDFYFINTFRNSILHPSDYSFDLFNLNHTSKQKLYSEAKTAIAKSYFLYKELENINLEIR